MIITLCGSARFEPFFHLWNEILTLSGHTVFDLAVQPSTKKGKKDWYTAEEKVELDKAHLRKIDASDAIFVINAFAYLGESTLNEIAYAKQNGKLIIAMESWGKGCGIGPNHLESYQKAAERFGVRSKSPIDVMEPQFKMVWDYLPKAGVYRSGLVEKIENFELIVLKLKDDE